jgi:heterodisulfide reductase subunit A-like polyferredoxin
VASPEPKLDATLTSLPGVVAAGTAIGPKDIVDSIVEASAAATKVAMRLGPPAMSPAPLDDGLDVEVRAIDAGEAVAIAGPAEVQHA